MTIAVDAVVYYRVSNATISVINVEDANRSTRLLAQTTLRTVLGTKSLSEILSDRENISHYMQVSHRPLPSSDVTTRHCHHDCDVTPVTAIIIMCRHRPAVATAIVVITGN